MSLTLLLVCAFASHRIWRLLARDTITQGFRDWLAKRWRGEESLAYEGWTCPWCLGSLISFAVVGAVAQVTSVRLPGLYALAVASIVGAVEEALSK